MPQAPVIITPHPGEMCRLNGRTMAELRADRLQTARVFAQTYRVITVLRVRAQLSQRRAVKRV